MLTRYRFPLFIAACTTVLAVGTAAFSAAVTAGTEQSRERIRLERLDRGLVAVATAQGVFLSWRLLGPEVTGHTATGMTGADFNVYRDGQRIATVTDSTNYLDPASAPTSPCWMPSRPRPTSWPRPPMRPAR